MEMKKETGMVRQGKFNENNTESLTEFQEIKKLNSKN